MAAQRTASPVIGITGAPGSGKSTTAQAFASLGAEVLALDAIGHALLEDAAVRREIVAQFGDTVFAPDGAVSRACLGAVVFADPDALAKLNAIVHPRMVERVQADVARWRAGPARGGAALVIEGALVYEMGLDRLCDEVVLVTSPEETRALRLMATRGWSREELRNRQRAQLDDEARAARADARIENASTLDDLQMKVEDLWKEWT